MWEYHESEWKCDCERESKWAQAEGEIERKKFPCRKPEAAAVGKTKPTTEEQQENRFKKKPSLRTGAEQMMLSDAQLLWKWKPSSILKMHDKINREQNVARGRGRVGAEGGELWCGHVQSIKVVATWGKVNFIPI